MFMALKHGNCCKKIRAVFYIEEQIIIVFSGEKQCRDGDGAALCRLTLGQSMELSELPSPYL